MRNVLNKVAYENIRRSGLWVSDDILFSDREGVCDVGREEGVRADREDCE